MKHHRLLLFLVWCLFVIATSYATLGSCDLVPVIIPLVMWVGGPLLLFMAPLGLYRLKQQDLSGFRWFGVVATMCFTGIAILWLRGRFCDWELTRGKDFVRKNLHQLEAHRVQHKKFPDSLAELKLSAPRMLKYTSGENSYNFSMEDPRRIWGGWLYDSDRKEWFHHD